MAFVGTWDRSSMATALLFLLAGCATGSGGTLSSFEETEEEDEDWGSGAGPSGTSGGGPSGATSSGGPPACAYPEGSYGKTVGKLIHPGIEWQGYAEHSTEVGTVAVRDYFDCDGAKGIHALLLIGSQTSCGVCQEEASELEWLTTTGQWGQLGIKVVTLMFVDAQLEPATTATALQWKQAFELSASAVVADPSFSVVAETGTIGTPLHVVVDPRTMKIVHIQEGYSPTYPQLVNLAQTNQTGH